MSSDSKTGKTNKENPVNKQTAIAAATVNADEIREEISYGGYVMTHTYYGRGWVPSDAEQIGNVLVAFRAAQEAADGKPVIFCIDEDAFFALPGDPALGPESDWTADERRTLIADCRVDEVAGEDAALLLWWESFGCYDSAESVPTLRQAVADTLGVPVENIADHEG
jgi:hypothetical protein